MKSRVTVAEFLGHSRRYDLDDVLGLIAGAFLSVLVAGIVMGMLGVGL